MKYNITIFSLQRDGLQRNGCDGGWFHQAWDYSIGENGRLATQADYPYTQSDGSCLGSRKGNGMRAARIAGHSRVASNEGAHIAALQRGSVSVAFEVTDPGSSSTMEE